MDSSYSENWRLLLNFLNNDSGKIPPRESSFFEHQQAYALALFLVDATLATPALDRCNVAKLIAGELTWPCSSGLNSFSGTDYSLEFFETGGFISFPGGWVKVHCRATQQTKSLDKSVDDILHVINLLQNFNFGREGYVQPHFVIKNAQLDSLISKEFGDIHLDRLFPYAVQQEGGLAIYPEKYHFSQLESTYLWQCLLRRYSPDQAFRKWMVYLRVLTHTIIPIQFRLLEKNEIDQFLQQVEFLVKSAPEFSYTLRTIHKQAVNSSDFARVIQPVMQQIDINIGSEDFIPEKNDKLDETAPLILRTAETLDGAYNFPNIDDPAEITTQEQWQHLGRWLDPMEGLSWLLQECFNHAILIDHQTLTAKKFALNLLSLSKSRPALKYLLFIALPLRFNSKYILFLLSRPETCEIAIYHLTNREYPLPVTRRHDVSDDLSNWFLDVLAKEYVRTIKERSDNGLKLLDISLYLADNSGFYKFDNAESFQFKALNYFLNKLDDNQVAAVVSAFLETIPEQYEWRIQNIRERSVYYLGLWLIQRLECTDIVYRDLLTQLCEYIICFYKNAFTDCISTRGRDLKSDNFFAILPWQSLINVIGFEEILRVSRRYDSWATILTYKHERGFDAISSISQYLQLLMLISKSLRDENIQERAWQRIINIVCAFGFGREEGRYYLFKAVINDEATDLWRKFSLFVNTLPPSKYEDFTERCIDMIPLDSLYILLERCNIHEREQVIHDAILERQELSDEKLGLKSLETAFIHACQNGHMELAERVLSTAKPLLERFRGYSQIQFRETIYRWEAYQFKHTLLLAYLNNQKDPYNFEKVVFHIPLPDSLTGLPENELVRNQLRECEQFRRYITATAFCEIEPSKTVQYMEALCAEVNAPHYAFTLFKGHLSMYSDSQNKSERRQALNKFLEQTSSITPDQLAVSWVAMILDVMIQIGDQQRADEFWRVLSDEQRKTREILLPYCKGLIQRGQALIASQIINEFKEFNLILSENDVDLSELISNLSQALPSHNSILDIVHAMAESSQRSIEQLKQHYTRIIGGSFEDYVNITDSASSKEMFLKKVMIEVAYELLLRKKNLQSQQSNKGQLNKIINEDLINDWFTSLFDMRMAEARIGFRDQKRTGSSESGKSPGESDGLITDSKNKRIAIFEAFRLFSLSKKVITEHLNKVSGYDAEALSPVFIIVYCDINNFSSLADRYYKFISKIDYLGYKKNSQAVKIDQESVTDNFWVCTETRLRGGREVMFCHLLLNMHCN